MGQELTKVGRLEIAKMREALSAERQRDEISERMVLIAFAEQVEQFGDEIVTMACRRYTAGNVPGQSMLRPPTVPEFVKECESRVEYMRAKEAHKALPPPRPTASPDGMTPFERMQRHLAEEFEGYELLEKDLSHHEFARRCRNGEMPVGAIWKRGMVYAKPGAKPRSEAMEVR